jgi:hypothetical protein
MSLDRLIEDFASLTNRRQFLRKAAAATLGVALGGLGLADAAMANGGPYAAACCGLCYQPCQSCSCNWCSWCWTCCWSQNHRLYSCCECFYGGPCNQKTCQGVHFSYYVYHDNSPC